MSEKITHTYNQETIQVLEGLDPVRKRPGMYIGSTDGRGLHHLVTEIVDNSIDEALAGYCTHIEVFIFKDGSVRVQDNGRGIPTGIIEKEGKSAVEVVMTKLHAGGKFGGGGYKISGGLHGVGLSVVNALSEWMDVEIHQNGRVFRQRYNRGVPERELQICEEANDSGTRMTFYPDSEIFETLDFQYDIMKNRLRELAYLNKGLRITLTDQREGQEREETFMYEGGIRHFVEQLNKTKTVLLPEVVYLSEIGSENEVEIAIQYNDSYNEVIYAYANNINTEEGGAHLDGFKAALTKIVNEYGVKTGALKENEKLTGDDVREGLTAIISVKLQEPQFEGQTKTKLGNSEMRTLVSRIVCEKLGEYFEENPKVTKELILKSINAQKAREAARKARDTIRKGVLESTTLPGKLSDCSETNSKLCEIYLVEGDSAGGTAKQGRDNRFQAILPLKGKILNVEKARLNKVLDNDEIMAMIKAFGAGFKENFDESKLRYDRIVCMTDADVDGSHIRILLLTFFFRFMRPLIENGHVYIAMPPLYKISRGNNINYCYSDQELEKFFEENGRKGWDLQRYKGLGEMNAHQLYETTMDPSSRTLLQVTMDDAVTADEIFTVLMGEQPELRRAFIEQNAKIIKELDI